MKVTEYRKGFYSLIKDQNLVEYHKNFNLQGSNFYIHNPFEFISKESTRHQTIKNHSLIVYLNPQRTYIDEALEGYELGRSENLDEI